MSGVGKESIITVDRYKQVRKKHFLRLLAAFIQFEHSHVRPELGEIIEDQWEKLCYCHQHPGLNLEEMLSIMGIQYWVGDTAHMPFPSASFDFISSNNTFEHIDPGILGQLLQEMYRLLSERGMMSHYVDMVDHYSYFDSSISPLNYLRFSERAWKWIENPLQNQNRLRLSQYTDLYDSMKVPLKYTIDEQLPAEALTHIKLAWPYTEMRREDLRISYSQLISIKE